MFKIARCEIDQSLAIAVRAAESRMKDLSGVLFDLTGITSFTDYFIICTGSNPKQIQAIADEIGLKLKESGELPIAWRVTTRAMDSGRLRRLSGIAFSGKRRAHYDLERFLAQRQGCSHPV